MGLLAVAVGACQGRTAAVRDADRPVAEQVRRVDQMLDELEQRLLAGHSKVTLWEELQARHETVSGIACRNLGEHARAVALFDEREGNGRAALRKNRIASRLDPAVPLPRR